MQRNQLTLITGGSRGIGHFLVQMFLRDTDVLNISRKPARVADGASRCTIHNLAFDLENVTQIEPSLSTWFGDHPGYEVTTLVHNAAISNLGWLDQVSTPEIEQVFRVNVHAPLTITAALMRAGRFSEREACVAYITSSLARPQPDLSFAGLGLYSISKAALSRLALVQRREFELAAPHIRVLQIHPGIVDTDLQRELRRDTRLDPAFGGKTAGLPPYQEGEWDSRSPKDCMRTVSPQFSAEFVVWAMQSAGKDAGEHDFYQSEEFHAARTARMTG
jgi:NAD(P)-dependent dehydrogenase (short-subunit alcohol dehydrogenase family)